MSRAAGEPTSVVVSKRKCLIVLGMHRSGTSALTRALNLLGADLPNNLMPPRKGNNETGFWEPKKIVDLHDRMLREAGSRWNDWRAFDIHMLPGGRQGFYREEIRRLIDSEFDSSSLFVLKDPRISRFASVYIQELSALGIEPSFVHCNRNPLSVAASLSARDNFTETFAQLVWLRHELAAEFATRGSRRVFVSYEGLIEGWRQQLDRIAKVLGIVWPVPIGAAAEEIDRYISPVHRHHLWTQAELQAHERTLGWVREAYSAVKSLEQDAADAGAMSRLDVVRHQMDIGSEVFGQGAIPELLRLESDLTTLRLHASGVEESAEATNIELSRARADAVEAHQEVERARLELEQARLDGTKARQEASLAKLELERMRAEAAEARREVDRTKRDLDRARDEVRHARTQSKLIRKQNVALLTSTSWRVTRPMRGLKRLVSERGFARKCIVAASRLVYNRLKLYRMLDWPIAGALIHKAKAGILGVNTAIPVHQAGSVPPSFMAAQEDHRIARPALAISSGLRRVLDDQTGRVIGDPSEAVLSYARQIMAAAPAPFRVSVVMPTWNRMTTVATAIRSALDQSFPPFEIIVSDDGSTDDTLDAVELAFAEQIRQGQIKIIRNAHKGVSAARNAALEASSGDLVAYLDSDNTWRKNFLLVMCAVFAESDDVNVAYAALRHESPEGRVLVRGSDYNRARLLTGNYIDMNVLVHRRMLYKQYGGFRRELTRLVDWDLIIRYTKNYKPEYLPFIGVDYNLGSTLNNITNTQPLAENYKRVLLPNLPERLSLGLERLRLAYFVYDYPALSQTFVLAEIRELLRRGVDLKVYYVASPDMIADVDFEVESYKVSSASELASLLVKHERTVCHSQFAYPGVTNFVWPACQAAGIYYTFMPHAVDIFHEKNRKRSQVGALGADPLCLKVLVYGDFHRKFLEDQGVPRNKIAYAFQAVDLTAFERVQNKQIAWKSGGSPFKIVAIGRFIEKKGFADLIRAMSLLPEGPVELDIYGYGPLEEELRALVAELKLRNVNFPGAIKGPDALTDVYANADMLAAPCIIAENGDMDGFPTVILEAMAAGVPVLTTSVSAIPDYVRNGVEGLLVPPHSPQALADAITAYRLSSPSRKAAMISRAKALVNRAIGVEKTVQRLLDTWLGYAIDIVLVTFNDERHDDRAETFEIINRVIEKTTTSYTLTIIDNGSDEGFWEQLVERVQGRLNVRLIRKSSNAFCGPACNQAIAHGTAEFIIYLCSKEGFIKEHGWERGLIDQMRQRPDVGMAGHLVHLPKYTLGAELAQHPMFPLFRSRELALQNPKRRFLHVQGGAKIIRRSMFEAAGGYNETTPQDNMDVELSYHFESLGYRLAQLPEVASITQKTLPRLGALLDERTVVAHPLNIDTAAKLLDSLTDRGIHLCNVCGETFPAFISSHGKGVGACPRCGSLPLERLVYRALSNAPYVHRGAKLAYLGETLALPDKLAGRMFRSVVAEENVAQFLRKIRGTGEYACIVIDSDLLGTQAVELWGKIAEVVQENGEIILVEPHSLTDTGGSGAGAPREVLSGLQRRSLQAKVSVFDLASELVGYDWRRLRRMDVVPCEQTASVGAVAT